ncbi:MAG: hypothetical protein CFH43_00088 [Proteobacteria bacterium]|nr:MAG: hypothetical protein CFH43_00088 [Pseudomonadota bacterium]
MSKKGILNSIKGFLSHHKGLITGAGLLTSVAANKAMAQDSPHQSPSLQEYAQTMQVDTAQFTTSDKAKLYKKYVNEHGLSEKEIKSTLHVLNDDCESYGKRTCAIAEIYQEAFDRHEDNIMMLQYKDMRQPNLSGQDKIGMIDDRTTELKNIYGEYNDYEYKQTPAQTSSTAPENQQIQNMLDQSITGEFDENQLVHDDTTYAELGGLAVYVSIQSQAREDVLERGLLEHSKRTYEAQAEMEEFQNHKEQESQFKNPFGGSGRDR